MKHEIQFVTLPQKINFSKLVSNTKCIHTQIGARRILKFSCPTAQCTPTAMAKRVHTPKHKALWQWVHWERKILRMLLFLWARKEVFIFLSAIASLCKVNIKYQGAKRCCSVSPPPYIWESKWLWNVKIHFKMHLNFCEHRIFPTLRNILIHLNGIAW